MPQINSTDNTDQFLAVVDSHKGIIYKVASAYCRFDEDRKDLVQEIIAQLWRSFNTYDSKYKYSTWIYRIALNTAISFYRKGSSQRRLTDPMSVDIIDIVDPGRRDDAAEQMLLLQQFIAELKELDKALMLLYLDERSYKEIADIMGITETNVATKISRIKGILKRKYSQVKT